MRPFVSYASHHPAIANDRAFFEANPHRLFRARKLTPKETPFPEKVLLLGTDEFGGVGEINLVILKRFQGGRLRYHFARYGTSQLDTDASIVAFLRSRGIDPWKHRILRAWK